MAFFLLQMNEIVQLVSEYQSIILHQLIDYEKLIQYSIVHHSSSIEGSTLTENETSQNILLHFRKPENRKK